MHVRCLVQRGFVEQPHADPSRGALLMVLLPTSKSLVNALETYVRKLDASRAWKRTEQKKIRDATVTHLKFFSQTWRGHLWSHDLLVFRPITVRGADTAMLFITGDNYNARDELATDRFMKWRKEPARSWPF
jgi:PhoPQ-activated pathogenicity-related protein